MYLNSFYLISQNFKSISVCGTYVVPGLKFRNILKFKDELKFSKNLFGLKKKVYLLSGERIIKF